MLRRGFTPLCRAPLEYAQRLEEVRKACPLPPPPAAPKPARLIAQQQPEDVGKITLVLDMDETLVYARSGVVHRRPHLKEFLASLKDLFEVSFIHSCFGSSAPAWDVLGREVGQLVWGVTVT